MRSLCSGIASSDLLTQHGVAQRYLRRRKTVAFGFTLITFGSARRQSGIGILYSYLKR